MLINAIPMISRKKSEFCSAIRQAPKTRQMGREWVFKTLEPGVIANRWIETYQSCIAPLKKCLAESPDYFFAGAPSGRTVRPCSSLRTCAMPV